MVISVQYSFFKSILWCVILKLLGTQPFVSLSGLSKTYPFGFTAGTTSSQPVFTLFGGQLEIAPYKTCVPISSPLVAYPVVDLFALHGCTPESVNMIQICSYSHHTTVVYIEVSIRLNTHLSHLYGLLNHEIINAILYLFSLADRWHVWT